jgi:hypothetical protein
MIQHSLFSKGRLVQRHVQRHSTACIQTCADPTLDGVAVWLLLVRSLLLNCLQAVPSAAACCTQRNVPPRCGMGSKPVASIARSSRCVVSSTDALKVHTVLHRRYTGVRKVHGKASSHTWLHCVLALSTLLCDSLYDRCSLVRMYGAVV